MFEKIQKIIKAVFRQEYARASIYYIVANIIGQGIVLLSSAVFTRMMSQNDFGLASTYSTWVLVINTFICLNLFITVRNAYIDFRDDYDNFVSSVLLLSVLVGIVVTLVILGVSYILGKGFGFEEVLLACVQSIALNIVNYMMAVQSMKNEYKQRAVMMIAPNWTHIILSIVLMLVFSQNLYMAKIAGNAIGLLIFGIISSIILFKNASPRIIPQYWKYSLKISTPSIFNTLSDLILMQSDRLMLTAMVGAEETAEYSVVYNVSSIIVAVYQAINGAWTPWFYKKAAQKDKSDTIKIQSYYLLGFTIFTFGMMTISPELIKLISPHNYWAGIRYAGAIIIASYLIFLFAFFSTYLLYRKETGKIARNTLISALLNLVLNYFWITRYKAVGAVMATVVSYFVLFILHYLSIGKEGMSYFANSKVWLNLLSVIVYGVLCFFIRDIWFLRYISFAIVVVLVYFFKGRKIIRNLFNT